MGSEVGGGRRFSSYWRDVAWQSSGASLAQLVGIAGLPVLTRLYTPEDFAVQSLFLQVVTYATALVTWRYEYFVQLPKLDDDVRALNGLVLALGVFSVLILTPLCWIFRDGLAQQLGNQDVAPWLFLAPATAVLVSWAITAQNNAQRFGDFKTSGLSELVGKLSYVFTGVTGAWVHLGSVGLVITTAMAAIGKSAYVFLLHTAWGKGALRTGVEPMQRVRVRYGRLATSTVFAHLLTTSAIAMPQIAMAHLYGADVLGQFALVLATIYLPSGLLGAAIGQVYYQRAAQQWAEGLPFFALWRSTAHKLVMIGLPVYGIVALLSEFAYPYIFGDQWQLAGEFAALMAVAACGSFVTSPLDRTCLVVGAGSYSVLWSIYRTASTVVVIWLAWAQGFTPMSFVIALMAQMCLAYGIDFWMNRRFSQGRLGVFANR
jgi:teichuronic acid exporter